ncbi:MAG TPA: CoA-binding protein [Chitinophagaceae bacterium]|nr:CoA-binding protein [Chitinophagaceae bacterium]HML57439.1 CoA-binding protein [Ferruginibacter sp.]
MKKKTLILGASSNPNRYSYLALEKLQRFGHPVLAIGRRKETVLGVDVKNTTEHYDEVDTITLYLNPDNQKPYYNYILSLHPKRIIFNPGTENDELVSLAEAKGIQTIEACTLVMLSTGQY